MTMTTVLVAYDSKMGATREIAEVIGAELARAGLTAEVRDAGDVTHVRGYDAVVLGSAIYASRWRSQALRVLDLIVDQSSERAPTPTWLFHSGPCGENAARQEVVAPKRVRRGAHRLGIAPPVTFGGRLEPATAQGFIARKMAKSAMAGDYRDFDRIRTWAYDIAEQLTAHYTVTVH